MPRLSLTDLPWLPRTGADFRAELRSVEQNEVGEWGSRLRSLSNQHLGLNQAIALARTLELLRARSPSSSLSTFRLGLVSNAAMDFLKPLLVASALRYGIALEIIAADFGQIMQEAIDPASLINTSKPDAVLLAVDHRGFPVCTASPGWPLFDPLAAIDELRVVRDALRRNCGALSLVQTLPAPMGLLFGSLDVGTSGTLRSTVAAINLHLARDVPERGDVLVDIEWLANAIGLDEWYDDRHWHMARMPCAQKALPLYAEFVARCLAAIRGKSRKCLILDLDNTLWGGVIGDDGLEGIAINPGDARGEAFRAIQAAALDLRNRGVVLAVCSKNEDAIARTPFRSHGGMLLKEDDIAVFMGNWDDKATNIERIAQRLELGLD